MSGVCHFPLLSFVFCSVSSNKYDIPVMCIRIDARGQQYSLGGDIHVVHPAGMSYLYNNPSTLRVSSEIIVCYSHTFDNNLRMKQTIANISLRIVQLLNQIFSK